MPQTTSPQTVRSLYRRLLRELPTTPPTSPIPRSSAHRSTAHQKLSSPSLLQQQLRSTFSSPSTATNSNSKAQLQMAEQAIQYVQAQRMYATLIERYNPGMGMSEEERVRLTARKVGMDLPPEFSR
ncbi:hypothetical protein DM02DRAFT_127882 [Periconia macrospinosa]|uniref:Ras guanyl-nucleotide exchange factor RasGEF n=1 Tax=Periconia macrospinosa TaxID=97972 RepID=A0A2V1E4X1_9PLEO|nr:hypothetical protein DM02DRAFT_127882 [Periconia macrospinosa]